MMSQLMISSSGFIKRKIVVVLGCVYMEEGQAASPLGRASPSERAGFHPAFTWGKPALLPWLACLAESPGLTTFIFPRNPGFSFYNLCINKQNL